MILKTINFTMKKLIFLLLLALPFFGFSQAAYLMEFTNPNGSKVVFNLNDVRSCVAEGTGSYLFTRTGSGKTQVQESPATIATNSCGNIVLFTVYLPANQFNTTKEMGVNPNYVVGVVSNTSGNGVLKMVNPTENFTTTGTYAAAVAELSVCVSGGGGGGGSLTNTYVGFGDGLNQLDGEAGFTYDAESNRLAVDTVKTKRISSKAGPLEILNDTKFNAYPNTRDDSGVPVNILGTDASGNFRSDPVSSLAGLIPDSIYRIPNTSFFSNTAMFARIQNGRVVSTDGFYTAGDGGGANYLISASGTADGIAVFAVSGGRFATVLPNPDGSLAIKQLGAIGDGVTNSTSAIRKAIMRSKYVFFGSGDFIVSDSISVQSGQRVDGGCATVKQITANKPIFSVVSKSNVKIMNLKLIGKGDDLINSSSSLARGISIFASTDVYVLNCDFVEFTNSAVNAFQSTRIKMDGCNISFVNPANESQFTAGMLYEQSTNSSVSLCVINGTGQGISVASCENIIISGNSISNIAYEHGMYIDGASVNISIVNNSVNTTGISGGIGIKIQINDGVASKNGENLDIVGNVISNTGGNGIHVVSTSATPIYKLKNINITGNSVFKAAQDGIYVAKCDKVIITSNVVDSVGRDGISYLSNNDLTVNGNSIYDAGSDGILINGADRRSIVSNNYIYNAGRNDDPSYRFGIYFSSGREVEIIGNTIIATNGKMQYGLFLTDSSNTVSICRNYVKGATGYGVYFYYAFPATPRKYEDNEFGSERVPPTLPTRGNSGQDFFSAAIPSTGTWTEGDFVRNKTASTGVLGWLRKTTGAGNVLGTDWIEIKQSIASISPVGSTPNANAATLTGSTLNLEPANASFPGVVTAVAQTFAGQKTINMASSGAVTQNLILDNTATAAVNSAVSAALSVAGVQRGEVRTTLTEIVGGGADYAKVEIKAQNGGALKEGITIEAKNAGVDNVSIWAGSDGALTTARRIVEPYNNVKLTGDATLAAGYSHIVLTGTQILTDAWTVTMPPSADMLDGEILTISNSIPGVTGATLQLTANSGQTLLGFTGTASFANTVGFADRRAIQLMFKSGGTWITLAQY